MMRKSSASLTYCYVAGVLALVTPEVAMEDALGWNI